MVSARETLSSIEQAITGARRDEDRLTAMLRSASEEAARLRADQADSYKALAKLKFDAIARDEVVSRLDAAERRARDAIESRKAALADLAGRRDALSERVTTATEARDRQAERVEKAVDAVEDLAEKTRARLAGDAGATAKAKAVETAEAVAAAAAEKASRAEADREEKRKPYEADRLFMYLWERGYGTAKYRAGPLARYFDAKVARIVGYDAARPNYYMLNEIPLRLREHANRLEQAAADARAAQEAFERQALENDGIAALEAAVAAEQKALAEAEATLDEAEAALAGNEEEQRKLLDPANDQSLSRATDDIAAALAREDLSALYQEALKTPTPEDEKIVKHLREIEMALARRDSEAEEVRKASVEMAKKRTELERTRDSFRTSGYNNPRGEFINGAVIGSILTEVLRGATSGRSLDDALRQGYRQRPPRTGGRFGGGLSFPGSGGGSRPRPPSPPRGGGGFRTGGGF